MSHRSFEITSIDALRAAAAACDDLWQRSDVTLPTMRAELLAQWLEHFAPQADFRMFVVADQGQWVAALPLVRGKAAGVIPAAAMPSNEWSSSGDLLLDPTAETDRTLDLLVAALRKLPWPLVWLDEVPLQSPRWQALKQALARAAMTTHQRVHYRVGRVEITHDWEAYRHSWSRKHRQKMAAAARTLHNSPEAGLLMGTQFRGEEVEPWLRRGFEIEHRSWKGRARSSVLCTPGMFRWLVRQAEQLARWGQLELGFLHGGRRDLAFVYGMTAKGVFHSCKIGYDPDFAHLSPGQLLRCCLLEQFHAESQRRWLDFQGPMTDAHRPWRPVTYAVGRLAIAHGPLLGRTLVRTYQWLRPTAADENHADTSDCQSASGSG